MFTLIYFNRSQDAFELQESFQAMVELFYVTFAILGQSLKENLLMSDIKFNIPVFSFIATINVNLADLEFNQYQTG